MGSGELIATTTLGARVGMAALWLILLSCLIKVVVQEELGRYAISSGETTLQALNRVPGPRFRVSWVVVCWAVMAAGITFQLGGIAGGLGQVFHLALPQLGVNAWSVFWSTVLIAMLLGGGYRHVERASALMVACFTFITVACAVLLAWTPYRVSPGDLVAGLRLDLPPGGLAVAFAVFGITGVGASELIYYPYWCLEKGYARFAGTSRGTPGWIERARGWIRVMQIDARLAMVVYTLATVAFYILGAAVLHRIGDVPEGYGMVATLSSIYTTTLGPWAFYLFLLGAFIVLFSTLFSSTAANSRVYVDFLELCGAVRISEEGQRRRWQRGVVVFLLLLYPTWHALVGQPVLMVIVGGVFQASMLPIIGFSTLYLRYRHLEPGIRPSLVTDALLLLCSSAMLLFAIYSVVDRLSRAL